MGPRHSVEQHHHHNYAAVDSGNCDVQREQGGMHIIELHVGTLLHGSGLLVVVAVVVTAVYLCVRRRAQRRLRASEAAWRRRALQFQSADLSPRLVDLDSGLPLASVDAAERPKGSACRPVTPSDFRPDLV